MAREYCKDIKELLAAYNNEYDPKKEEAIISHIERLEDFEIEDYDMRANFQRLILDAVVPF